MTDGEALRRAIVADPDDDTPRLIYADWLDENNRPDRAAFIRHQIEAARAEPDSPRARDAARRAAELLDANNAVWSRHVRTKVVRVDYVRGFIGHATIDAGRFAEVAPQLFAAEPVQSVGLIRFWPDLSRPLTEDFAAPEMERVRDLSLPAGAQGVTEDELNALSASPRLARLESLTLRGNGPVPAWLSRTLTGKALPNLTGLTLSDMAHLGPGLSAAAEKAGHRRFKRLDVSGVTFTVSHLHRLLASPCMRKLEELIVRPPEGALNAMSELDLGWVLPWETLRKLDLGGQRLGANAVQEFVRLPECKGLRRLGLSGNKLRAAGARALTESQHLNLNYLDVRDNDLDDDDLAALRARFPQALVEG